MIHPADLQHIRELFLTTVEGVEKFIQGKLVDGMYKKGAEGAIEILKDRFHLALLEEETKFEVSLKEEGYIDE